MKKGSNAILIVAIAAVVLILGGLFISVNNKLVKLENGIVAVDQDMQNVHAEIFNNIKSQGLTVEKYGDMVIQAMQVSMTGRYGQTGAQAGMLWLKEQNPSISADLYTKLMTVIEAGYKSFSSVQRRKIDEIRVYKNELQVFPNNVVAGMLGFPRMNLKDMEKVISTAETKKTFETKEMDTINPFSDKKEKQ